MMVKPDVKLNDEMSFELKDGTRLFISMDDARKIANTIIIECMLDKEQRERLYLITPTAFRKAEYIYNFYKEFQKDMDEDTKHKFFLDFLDACKDNSFIAKQFDTVMEENKKSE